MDAVTQPEPHNSAPSGGAGAPIAAALWRSIDHRSSPFQKSTTRIGSAPV
jgi:hypothetical protein